MKKAIFYGGLREITQPIQLICIISIDNIKQNAGDFECFVDLINQTQDKITTLKLIDTSYLHRYYDDGLSNMETSNWIRKNASIIKKIKISCEVISWREVILSEAFSQYKKMICLSYYGDEQGNNIDETFHEIVLQLARQHAHKRSLKAAIEYVLEECAGLLTLNGHIAYPGKFNSAINYVLDKYRNKYNINIQHHFYKIISKNHKKEIIPGENKREENAPDFFSAIHPYKKPPSPSQGRHDLSFFVLSLAYLAESFKITTESRARFFQEFLLLCEKYGQSHPLEEGGTPHHVRKETETMEDLYNGASSHPGFNQ